MEGLAENASADEETLLQYTQSLQKVPKGEREAGGLRFERSSRRPHWKDLQEGLGKTASGRLAIESRGYCLASDSQNSDRESSGRSQSRHSSSVQPRAQTLNNFAEPRQGGVSSRLPRPEIPVPSPRCLLQRVQLSPEELDVVSTAVPIYDQSKEAEVRTTRATSFVSVGLLDPAGTGSDIFKFFQQGFVAVHQ